jgi:hypothetical protein
MVGLSVIIPHVPRAGNDWLVERCVRSLNGDYDELIIVVNECGLARAWNQGLRVARGEYLAMVTDDTVLMKGRLRDLCQPGTVVAAHILDCYWTRGFGDFYVWPRSVMDEVGMYDEAYEIGYWEDEDIIMRWREKGVPIVCSDSVHVWHEPDGSGQTLQHIDPTKGQANRDKFIAKWGGLPDRSDAERWYEERGPVRAVPPPPWEGRGE